MLSKVAGLILGGLLLSIDMAHAQDAKTDQDKLQGSWDLTKAVHRGAEMLPEGFKFRVTGNTMKMIPPKGKAEMPEFTFKLDPTKKPKAFDRIGTGKFKGQLYPGIYEFKGDTFRFCIPVKPTKIRTTKFVSPRASHLFVMTLKRTKQKSSEVTQPSQKQEP